MRSYSLTFGVRKFLPWHTTVCTMTVGICVSKIRVCNYFPTGPSMPIHTATQFLNRKLTFQNPHSIFFRIFHHSYSFRCFLSNPILSNSSSLSFLSIIEAMSLISAIFIAGLSSANSFSILLAFSFLPAAKYG